MSDHNVRDCDLAALRDRVEQFEMLQLPGQPLIMHMGTSYLVRDLWRMVKELSGEHASAERQLSMDILSELERARAKFPGDNVTLLALMEEVGELAKASFEEPRDAVRKEAVQVAVMAMRVVLDGDATLNDWRKRKGLDRLAERGAA